MGGGRKGKDMIIIQPSCLSKIYNVVQQKQKINKTQIHG